jgi:DNA modification methylase
MESPADQVKHARVEAQGQPRVAYKTSLGRSFLGQAESVLQSPKYQKTLQGQVDLIFTSPPFPLNRKKKYGNEQGEAYVKWLANFAPLFKKVLKPKGSIVLELGNAWEAGRPVMSTLALKALLAFLERGEFTLCQQFVWYNPARLPSPAQWVNVERIRVKDAYTHLWWMSTTDRPHADNRKVLTKYSESMERLLEKQSYNTGKRPSEHHIGKTSFLKKNAGAIPSNLITLANTQASSDYLNYCRAHDLQPHPARMPSGLAEFFIKFLTKPKRLVLDPFAGSNTTGAAAEKLGRRWLAIEANDTYLQGSRGRFASFNGHKNGHKK